MSSLQVPLPAVDRSRLFEFWVPLGLILTSAIQMRFIAGAIGFGELILFGWMFLATLASLRAGHLELDRAARYTIGFWSLAFGALFVGTCFGVWHGVWLLDKGGRDWFAYANAATFSILFATRSVGEAGYYRVARNLTWIALCVFLPLAALAQVRASIGPIELWSTQLGSRLIAWTAKPNQLALFLLPVPFLCFYLARQATRGFARALYVACAFATIVTGVLTGSEALLVGWGCGMLFAFFASWLLGAVRAFREDRPLPLVVLSSLAALLVLVLAILSEPLVRVSTDAAFAMYYTKNQAAGRFLLIRNGLLPLEYSPVFGLGPGPYSGGRNPFEGLEAHNTTVDWANSAGLLGSLLYAGFLGVVAWVLWRRRQVQLLGGFIALFVFAQFHFVLRHPIYWCFVILLLKLPAPGRFRPGSA